MTMEKERQEFTSWQFGRIIQLEQELAELRAWEEKARPFLVDELEFVNDILSESDPYDDPEFMQKEIEKHAILTELIKGE